MTCTGMNANITSRRLIVLSTRPNLAMSFSNFRVRSEGKTLDQKFSSLPKEILYKHRVEAGAKEEKAGHVLHPNFGTLETERFKHSQRICELRGASLDAVVDVRCAVSTQSGSSTIKLPWLSTTIPLTLTRQCPPKSPFHQQLSPCQTPSPHSGPGVDSKHTRKKNPLHQHR